MDKGQILMDYRLAKNHKRQIPILADLNVCDTQTIVEILEEGGYKRMRYIYLMMRCGRCFCNIF